MSRGGPNPRSVLGATVFVLLALALLPTPLTGWVRVVREPVMLVIAPIAQPLDSFAGRLRGEPRPERDPEEELTRDQLERALVEMQRENASLRAENRELAALVEQLGRLRVATGIETRAVPATRVARLVGDGVSEYRPGSRAGVVVNAVAITPGGLQIVGIVTRVGAMTSTVHLLTDEDFQPGLVVGVVSGPQDRIESTAALDAMPAIQLAPTGRGTLVAPDVDARLAQRISVGDAVRVLDETWPRSAQLLVLGRVRSVTPTDDPLFVRVVVEPEVDPSRVRSVLLRMPASFDDGGAGLTGSSSS